MRKKIISITISILMLASVFLPATVSAAGLTPASAATYRAIDIAHHENDRGPIDYQAVKGSVDAMYVKATEGVTYTDPAFDTNARGAAAAGIPVGFYQFFYPWSGGEFGEWKARQEADSFFNATKEYASQLIPMVDVEEVNGCSAQEITDDVAAYCDEIVRVDGAPGVIIYASTSFIHSYLGNKLNKYPLWVAHYGVDQPGVNGVWNNWTMWQYTDDGSMPGITGAVDMDTATAGIFIGGAPTPTTAHPVQTAVFRGDPAVLAYQQKLNHIQIPRPVLTEDGLNGPKTRAGVQTFERVENLTLDLGIWGRQCNAAYSTITAKPTLRIGSTGQAVRYLQYRLGVTVDSKFGPKTQAAVVKFERSNRLAVDSGIVGPQVWRALGVN